MDESPAQGRYSHSSGMRRALELPRVDPRRCVQVGTRSFNFPASKRFIDEIGLTEVPARMVRRRGTEWTLARIGEVALGVSELRLALTHVLRNCLAPVIVAVTLNIGGMITALAGLSFLGLGVQPPTSDWGSMLAASRQYLNVAPHVAALPGIAIFLTVLGFNLLGDGLRDALDPRLR